MTAPADAVIRTLGPADGAAFRNRPRMTARRRAAAPPVIPFPA
jgi:hypothetical protein